MGGLGEKTGAKTKIELKETELSYCHLSVCLPKQTELNVLAQKWHMANFVPN